MSQMIPSETVVAGNRTSLNMAMAHAILRLTLGVIFLFYGIGKFMMGLGAFRAMMLKQFEPTWLPPTLSGGFATVLPFFEVILGGLLILGLLTRWALVVAGLLLVALTFGKVVQGDAGTVGHNLIFSTIIFLLLAAEAHNRISVDRLLTGRSHR